MRRVAWVVAFLLPAPLVPAPPALAGGNWLDFRREQPVRGQRALDTFAIVHVGERVVAFTGVYVRNEDRRARLDENGPYYAWLSRGDDLFRDARLPADAVRLAPFEVSHDGSVRATS